jgi:hypothetical protein
MRISVIHDGVGGVIGLVATPPGAPTAYLVPRAGERMAEVDVPELDAESDAQEIFERLADLAENYRIDIGEATLIPKQG